MQPNRFERIQSQRKIAFYAAVFDETFSTPLKISFIWKDLDGGIAKFKLVS